MMFHNYPDLMQVLHRDRYRRLTRQLGTENRVVRRPRRPEWER